MGKFGTRRKPKFLENTEFIPESHGAHENPVKIVSLGDHGDDHAMIVIRTEGGEEIELRFNYDGDGTLTSQHGEHEYTIPVEIEVVSDDDSQEIEETYEKLSKGQKKLDKNKNGRLDKKDFELIRNEKSGKAVDTFEGFVNECWTPMEEGYNPAMSEEAKRAIKAICEEILIKEAQMCDEDHEPMHTYENYLSECGQWMTECMMESAVNLPVDESLA